MTSRSDIERFNLQLPPDLKSELEREAERQGRSLAAVVRTALRKYVDGEREMLFVRELEAGYARVRDRDLALIDRMAGTELSPDGGDRGESAAGGGLPGEPRGSDRVRRGTGGRSARRRGPGKR